MQELIAKYGKNILPLALGLVAFYDRFIIVENEIDAIKHENTIWQTVYERENKARDTRTEDHESRIRELEKK